MDLKINFAIIHKLEKVENARTKIHDAKTLLDANDGPVLQLSSDVHKSYSSRQSKSYGEFDPDLHTTSAYQHINKLQKEAEPDFYAISMDLMKVLREKSDSQNFATGGHVLFFDYTAENQRWLSIAMVSSAPGTMVDDDFKVVEAPHLDIAGIRFAARINFDKWQANEKRYISFLSGKSGDISQYFQKFIGCSTPQQDLADSQALVRITKQFAKDQELTAEQREKLLSEVNQIAMEKADKNEPLELCELSNRVWPSAPDELNKAYAEADPPISNGFVPKTRGLQGFVRFKAKSEQWKLEFERDAVQSGAIRFNPSDKSITIGDLPKDVLDNLIQEFATNERAEDTV